MKLSKRLFRTAAVLFLVLTLSGSFAACALPNNSVNTTLTIQSEGTLTEEIVEDVTDADFTEEELRAFIEDSIRQFDASENPSVSLESCTLSGNSVKITMNYASVDVYSRYNNVPCFLGTLEEARAAGYDMDQPFLDPAGAEGEKDEITSREKEWKVFVCSEPIHLKLPDKILYSSDNVTITGRLTATVNNVSEEEAPVLKAGGESVVSGSAGSAQASPIPSAGKAEGKVHPYATVAHRYAYIIYK